MELLFMDTLNSLPLPSTTLIATTTPQKWTKILHAMDLTLQKMKALLMITLFCHYLGKQEEKVCQKWKKKLENDLGKEACNILYELISRQKSLNHGKATASKISLLPQKLKLRQLFELPYSDAKHELIQRFQVSEEKRTFLSDVLKQTKKYLLRVNEIPQCCSSGNKTSLASYNDDDNSSTSLSNLDSNGKEENSSPPQQNTFTSAVQLLKAALNTSKYKRHVLRCFNELDVESLMNILYLTYEDATGRHDFLRIKDRFQSLDIDDDDEFESFNLSEYEYDFKEKDDEAEEDGIQLPNVSSSPLQSLLNVSNDSVDATASAKKEILPDMIIEHGFGNNGDVALLFDSESRNSTMFSPARIDLLKNIKFTKLQQHFQSFSFETFYTSVNVESHKKLNEYFSLFRFVASIILKKEHGENARDRQYSNNLINYELLLIQMKKLQKNYVTHSRKKHQINEQLDARLKKLKNDVKNETKQSSDVIEGCIKEFSLLEIKNKRGCQKELSNIQDDITTAQSVLAETVSFVKRTTKSLRGRRHYLEASLDSLIRQYDMTMLKYQKKLDELQEVIVGNDNDTQKLQKKFKAVEENYDEMRAMRRLKELLANMEKAEVIKQNWAARKIQIAWRKYKIAKLRKKKFKGKRKGKKRTPPPQQGKGSTPPSKQSTPGPGSRSRSKSQTP